MTMDDLGVAERREQPEVERIAPLTPNVPRLAKHAHVDSTDGLLATPVAERHERGRYVRGHVTRQLERIPLASSDDAPRSEESRNDVYDPHRVCLRSVKAR